MNNGAEVSRFIQLIRVERAKSAAAAVLPDQDK